MSKASVLPISELTPEVRRVQVAAILALGEMSAGADVELSVLKGNPAQRLYARLGFRAARFGPRVLRTETAAVAAITALQVMAGDLQGT